MPRKGACLHSPATDLPVNVWPLYGAAAQMTDTLSFRWRSAGKSCGACTVAGAVAGANVGAGAGACAGAGDGVGVAADADVSSIRRSS